MTGAAERPLVLIVEDNDKNRKLFTEVLRYHGFQTLEARTSSEGVALALAYRPAVVLMDIQLPDLDGVQTLHQLRGHPERFAGAVVALTAYAMKDDEERFLNAGFDGYISKPIDILEFPGTVAQYCRPATGGLHS